MSNGLYVPGGRGNPPRPTREQIAAHHANTWQGLFTAALSGFCAAYGDREQAVEAAVRTADTAHKALMERTAQFFTAKQPADEEKV